MLTTAVLKAIAKASPAIVGALVAWLASTVHVVLAPSSEAGLVALCTAVLTAAWWALARLAERYWPWTAALIGDSPAAAAQAKAARKAAR